jgi:hypothetical protein
LHDLAPEYMWREGICHRITFVCTWFEVLREILAMMTMNIRFMLLKLYLLRLTLFHTMKVNSAATPILAANAVATAFLTMG